MGTWRGSRNIFQVKPVLTVKLTCRIVITIHFPDGLKLIASPWSPPAWMKTNHNMLQGGKVNKSAQDAWSRYIVKWIDAYKSYGVDMWGLTVQNEPESSQRWESCEFKAAEQADFVGDFLGPTLRAEYPQLKILGFDHNKDHLDRWAATLFNKSALSNDYMDGIAFHWYAGNCRSEMQNVAATYPGKLLVPTEACYELAQIKPDEFDGESFLQDGAWSRGEGYGHDIMVDLLAGSIGWTDWNLLLDESGGPNHVHNFCDAPVLVDTRKPEGELYFHPQYYYMGHFSRFLTPGSTRLHVKVIDKDLRDDTFKDTSTTGQQGKSPSSVHSNVRSENGESHADDDCKGWPVYGLCAEGNVTAVSFMRPDGKIAIVILNCADSSESLEVVIDGVGVFYNPSLPSHSIQTYVINASMDSISSSTETLVFFQRMSSLSTRYIHSAIKKSPVFILLASIIFFFAFFTWESRRIRTVMYRGVLA